MSSPVSIENHINMSLMITDHAADTIKKKRARIIALEKQVSEVRASLEKDIQHAAIEGIVVPTDEPVAEPEPTP